MHGQANQRIYGVLVMDKLERAISEIREYARENNLDFRKGLPEPLFLFATTMMPVANIDLLITNDNREVLLTWRDDIYFGKGWHIPGGCMRIKETIEERVQKTALDEIGSKVMYDKTPITVRESFADKDRPWLSNQLERSHNISLLFAAKLPEGYVIDNNGRQEHEAGYMKWFTNVPSDLLNAHRKLYGDVLQNIFNNQEEK